MGATTHPPQEEQSGSGASWVGWESKEDALLVRSGPDGGYRNMGCSRLHQLKQLLSLLPISPPTRFAPWSLSIQSSILNTMRASSDTNRAGLWVHQVHPTSTLEEGENKAWSTLKATTPGRCFRYVDDTWATIRTQQDEANDI